MVPKKYKVAICHKFIVYEEAHKIFPTLGKNTKLKEIPSSSFMTTLVQYDSVRIKTFA
jgi:hypothetical protein